MQLILNNNNLITEPIENIIYVLKHEANWNVFNTINNKGDYLQVTCPFHKDGKETHPSCSIYTSYDSDDIIPGTFHCFTCGEKGPIYKLVAAVLNLSEDEAISWLATRFGCEFDREEILFPEWDLSQDEPKQEVLNSDILSQYAFYHPYAQQRKISFDIAKRFSVGWNQEKNTLTFPVWDENNNLVMITERSINSKNFYIPEGVEKPVYLLNEALTNGYKSVIVCEGQIDALVAYSYGYPAIALFGAGTTDHQLEVIQKSEIRSFILMYDNDTAGRHGAQRFKQFFKNSCFITDVIMPTGRDIADLSYNEFWNILYNNNILLDNNIS